MYPPAKQLASDVTVSPYGLKQSCPKILFQFLALDQTSANNPSDEAFGFPRKGGEIIKIRR